LRLGAASSECQPDSTRSSGGQKRASIFHPADLREGGTAVLSSRFISRFESTAKSRTHAGRRTNDPMNRVLAIGLFVFFYGAGSEIAAAAEPCVYVHVHVHPKDTLRIDVPAGMRPTRSIAGFLVDVDSTGIVTKTTASIDLNFLAA